MRNSIFRRVVALVVIGMSGMLFSGCGGGDGLDGKTYHITSGGAMTIEFKDGKAKVEMIGETKTLAYKADKDTVTIINPDAAEGNLVLNRHPDGSLTCTMGTLEAK